MACGTGKTLVALWAVEQLQPKTVLVLVPSLTLLQQTLDEWSRHHSWENAFSYICVCSDPTVASKDVNDPITFHRADADFRVDTDPTEVRHSAKTSVKVLFSTYQSSDVVSQAMRGLGSAFPSGTHGMTKPDQFITVLTCPGKRTNRDCRLARK
jgi:predicted helicase